MIIRNFAGKDVIALELLGDGARVADDLSGAFLGGFLGFGIAIHEVNAVFEGRGGNVVEKSGESLFFVVSEAPDDKSNADTVFEGVMEVGVGIEAGVVESAHDADAA